MKWNYRLVSHFQTNDKHLAIHEVYYNDDDSISSITKNPIRLIFNDVQDAKETLEKIAKAFDKPILDNAFTGVSSSSEDMIDEDVGC